MPAERAAKIIVKGLERGKASISFPWQMALMMKLLAMLPATIFDRIMVKGPKKI